jgi:hypothetical protein
MKSKRNCSKSLGEQTAKLLGRGHGRPEVRILRLPQQSSPRELAELEAQEITRHCPTREIKITDAISKTEEILRTIERTELGKS